jgi:hypothetical protein
MRLGAQGPTVGAIDARSYGRHIRRLSAWIVPSGITYDTTLNRAIWPPSSPVPKAEEQGTRSDRSHLRLSVLHGQRRRCRLPFFKPTTPFSLVHLICCSSSWRCPSLTLSPRSTNKMTSLLCWMISSRLCRFAVHIPAFAAPTPASAAPTQHRTHAPQRGQSRLRHHVRRRPCASSGSSPSRPASAPCVRLTSTAARSPARYVRSPCCRADTPITATASPRG